MPTIDSDTVTTITSALIALVVVGVGCFMVVTSKPVPPEFWTGFALVLGFHFSNQVQVFRSRAR